jgi:hypothetical protein
MLQKSQPSSRPQRVGRAVVPGQGRMGSPTTSARPGVRVQAGMGSGLRPSSRSVSVNSVSMASDSRRLPIGRGILCDMSCQSDGQGHKRKRRIGETSGREDGAPCNKQVGHTMNATVGVNNTLARHRVHPGCAHVMPSTGDCGEASVSHVPCWNEFPQANCREFVAKQFCRTSR